MNANPIRVKTTRPTQTITTGFVIPAGTIGTVLDVQKNGTINYIVDFGLMPVISIPLDSPLITLVNGGER
jgi:hypothetical protein